MNLDYETFRERLSEIPFSDHPLFKSLRSDLTEWGTYLIEGYEPGESPETGISQVREDCIEALQDPECPLQNKESIKKDLVSFSKMLHILRILKSL